VLASSDHLRKIGGAAAPKDEKLPPPGFAPSPPLCPDLGFRYTHGLSEQKYYSHTEVQMTGSGEFAGALVGVTLRQYQKADSGGSWQENLEFLDSGLCTYCELHHDISDGGRRTEPEHGR
jgi:hypothetical protein